MTASCYLCAKGGHGTLPGTSIGDAVGTCKLCGVLACLGHGQRDDGWPAYICGICLANLLAVASTKQIPTAAPKISPRPPDGKAPQSPEGEKKPEPATTMAYAQWAAGINDPRDVIGDYDEQRWASVRADADYVARALSRSDLPRELRAFAGAELGQARVLMGAAVAIATQLSLPLQEMIPQLQPVADALLVRR
jgi:hypothetical protein